MNSAIAPVGIFPCQAQHRTRIECTVRGRPGCLGLDLAAWRRVTRSWCQRRAVSGLIGSKRSMANAFVTPEVGQSQQHGRSSCRAHRQPRESADSSDYGRALEYPLPPARIRYSARAGAMDLVQEAQRSLYATVRATAWVVEKLRDVPSQAEHVWQEREQVMHRLGSGLDHGPPCGTRCSLLAHQQRQRGLT